MSPQAPNVGIKLISVVWWPAVQSGLSGGGGGGCEDIIKAKYNIQIPEKATFIFS